jgi:tetratricopeptide (TPR) repeat protein
MMSCILVFYLVTWSGPGGPEALRRTAAAPAAETLAASVASQAADPDSLYAAREDLAKARDAAAIWAARVKAGGEQANGQPRDGESSDATFEAAWKLARARYWLGGHATESERKAILEDGIAASRTAVALRPNRPEGHFWMAANMGALAESFGMRQGLKYRGDIKAALLTVLKLDPAFQKGSADRALGRWYHKVPGLFGGSSQKSEEHLRKSLTYDPNSTASHFFLAETLLSRGRKAEAREELQQVLDAPLDPAWTPEDREFKEKARRLLATVK